MLLGDIRRNSGISVDEASKSLGISKSMLYKLEVGARFPSMKLLRKIAQVYNSTYDEIVEAIAFGSSFDKKKECKAQL